MSNSIFQLNKQKVEVLILQPLLYTLASVLFNQAFSISELYSAVVAFLLVFAAIHGVSGGNELLVVEEESGALREDCKFIAVEPPEGEHADVSFEMLQNVFLAPGSCASWTRELVLIDQDKFCLYIDAG